MRSPPLQEDPLREGRKRTPSRSLPCEDGARSRTSRDHDRHYACSSGFLWAPAGRALSPDERSVPLSVCPSVSTAAADSSSSCLSPFSSCSPTTEPADHESRAGSYVSLRDLCLDADRFALPQPSRLSPSDACELAVPSSHADLASAGSGLSARLTDLARVRSRLPRHVGRALAVSVLDQSGFGEEEGRLEASDERHDSEASGGQPTAWTRGEHGDAAEGLFSGEAGLSRQPRRVSAEAERGREGEDVETAEREATSYSFDFERFLDQEASAEPEGEEDFLGMLRYTPADMEATSEAVHRLSEFLSPSEDEDACSPSRERAFGTAFPLSSPTQLSSASLLSVVSVARRRRSPHHAQTAAAELDGDAGAAAHSPPFLSPPSSAAVSSSSDHCAFQAHPDSPRAGRVSSFGEQTAESPTSRGSSSGSRGRAYGSGKPVVSLRLREENEETLSKAKSEPTSALAVSQDAFSGEEAQATRSPPRKKANTLHGETRSEKSRSYPALPSLPFSSPRHAASRHDLLRRNSPSPRATLSSRGDAQTSCFSLEPVRLVTTRSSPPGQPDTDPRRSQPAGPFLSPASSPSPCPLSPSSSPQIERHHTCLLRDAGFSSPSLTPETRDGDEALWSPRSRMRARAQQSSGSSSSPLPSGSSPWLCPEFFSVRPALSPNGESRPDSPAALVAACLGSEEGEVYSSPQSSLRATRPWGDEAEEQQPCSRRRERESRRGQDARHRNRFSSPSLSTPLSVSRSRSSTVGARRNEGDPSFPSPQCLNASPYPFFFSPSLNAPFGDTKTPQKRSSSSRLSEKESYFSPRKTSSRNTTSLLSGRVGKRTRARDSPREATSNKSAAALDAVENASESTSSRDALSATGDASASWVSRNRWKEPCGHASLSGAAQETRQSLAPDSLQASTVYTTCAANLEAEDEREEPMDDAASPLQDDVSMVSSPGSVSCSSSHSMSSLRFAVREPAAQRVSLAACGRKRFSSEREWNLTWAGLPPEVLATLCQFLSFRDLAAFQRLDRRAYRVGSHATVWQELCANEWVNVPARERAGTPETVEPDAAQADAGHPEHAEEPSDAGEREEEMEQSSETDAKRDAPAEREHCQRVWEAFSRGEDDGLGLGVSWRTRGSGKFAVDFGSSERACGARGGASKRSCEDRADACMQAQREIEALETRRARWLNARAYANDYRRLYRDGNGWFPSARNSGQNTGARVATDGPESSWGVPRFTTAKMKLNPHLSNSMDTREDATEILIASEGVETPGGQKSSYIRVIDRETLHVVHEQQIPTRSLNCLDICPELYACGDDSGTIRLFSRRTHSLLHRYTSVGVVNMMAMYGLGPSQEVNDLRICRAEQQIVSVRTASRYPAGIEVVDLHTGKTTAITPGKTNGNWIHALDVEQDLSFDFPAFGPPSRRGSLLFSPDASSEASYSPPWRRSSITSLVAVGESSSAGCFSLLRLDLRCARPVVQEIPQTRRMLWPLRVHGSNVFVNSVFAANEMCGRIRQIDLRAPSPDICAQQHTSVTCLSEEGSKRIGSCMVHLLPTRKVEDIRVMGDFLYVLTDDADGCLQMLRFDTKRDGKAQLVTVVDTFDSSEWTEPLRLLQVNPQGWTCTYGNFVKFGRVADPEAPLGGESCEEINLASPLSLSAVDSVSERHFGK
ncbi:conserved hypothetical protein [Neospora caninum Liverpool]|uniref:F-box domain-containing protein n=1 Tax=Neospora caninum (strain Liverpool) TaxID=572307 RepID=F0VGH9_NEOCL|nr:conserved hypothetical protein [Neospora caninum Liverpool]CBZ52823.1 conserved hypothetical protein [Neospora caninum Liverpool]CEL66803.1 TPA: hypothetical protein BN1204_026120 [Neospora caninum Liverpool]|eukprot:XP_003882855.1 conserved hypothetical protein [Neospora caninum Liverpool]